MYTQPALHYIAHRAFFGCEQLLRFVKIDDPTTWREPCAESNTFLLCDKFARPSCSRPIFLRESRRCVCRLRTSHLKLEKESTSSSGSQHALAHHRGMIPALRLTRSVGSKTFFTVSDGDDPQCFKWGALLHSQRDWKTEVSDWHGIHECGRHVGGVPRS